jgi:hypothetical protein
MRQKLIAAAIQRFESQRIEAATNLEVYLECPAGVGEHPNVVQEVVKLARQIAEAEECIKTLQEF